jgi:hypothetical protein
MDAKVAQLPHFHPLTPTLLSFVDKISTTKLTICCNIPQKHWNNQQNEGWGKVGDMNTHLLAHGRSVGIAHWSTKLHHSVPGAVVAGV